MRSTCSISSVRFFQYGRMRSAPVGGHRHMPDVQGQRAVRHVIIYTDYCGRLVFERLFTDMGGREGWQVWGEGRSGDGCRPNVSGAHVRRRYAVACPDSTVRMGKPRGAWRI